MKYLFVPSHVDLLSLLAKNDRKHIDKYHYFLHKIYEERIFNKALKKRRGWVPISSAIMKEIVSSRQYPKIKKFLIEQGIIECDEIYSSGYDPKTENHYEKKCKWYRFTESYKQRKVRQHMIIDEVFEAKLKRFKMASSTVIDTAALNFLHFNLNEVKIDALQAYQETNQRLWEVDGYDLEKANLDTVAICKLSEGEFFFSKDSAGGRVHTNITNLSKWIRKHLYIETGEELVNLDIRNSQPLLLSILLKEEYGDSLPEDASHYIHLCEQGQFYEYMMKVLGEPTDVNRREFKERMFAKLFYCKGISNYVYQESKLFAKHFPSCAAVIKKHKKGDYTKLSVLMQKVESAIVIEGVIGKIASYYHPEDFFCLTVHDSIICTASQAAFTRELLMKEFFHYGLTPTINIETLSTN